MHMLILFSVLRIPIFLLFQIQWIPTTRRSRTKTQQVRPAQKTGRQRCQTVEILRCQNSTLLAGHSGCYPAFDFLHVVEESRRHRRVRERRRDGHVSGTFCRYRILLWRGPRLFFEGAAHVHIWFRFSQNAKAKIFSIGIISDRRSIP